MTGHEIDVADMQCWVFRYAQIKWNRKPEECAKIFQENKIFDFLKDCYGLLHVSSYLSALKDVEEILSKRGVAYANTI